MIIVFTIKNKLNGQLGLGLPVSSWKNDRYLQSGEERSLRVNEDELTQCIEDLEQGVNDGQIELTLNSELTKELKSVFENLQSPLLSNIDLDEDSEKTFYTAFETYRRTRQIGQGGRGVVYTVTNSDFEEFALKILQPEFSTRSAVKRFKNEIHFCQKDHHVGIIRVIDVGYKEVQGTRCPFYIMPGYNGTLRELMQKGIDPDKVENYFGLILNALECAHLKGVYHRDLKPENILYDEDKDSLVIADFGIAHFAEEELHTLVKTKNNERLANFQYAAPEQRMRARPVDHRADIFALGIILNEMFTEDIISGSKYRKIEDVAPEMSYLDDLVDEMISQSPEDRPKSIDIIKQQILARGKEFVTRQKLSNLRDTILPRYEVDDPLVYDPVRLTAFDYNRNNGSISLTLSQPVHEDWVNLFFKIENYAFIQGKEPNQFNFRGDIANIGAKDLNEEQIQELVKYL